MAIYFHTSKIEDIHANGYCLYTSAHNEASFILTAQVHAAIIQQIDLRILMNILKIHITWLLM